MKLLEDWSDLMEAKNLVHLSPKFALNRDNAKFSVNHFNSQQAASTERK